MTLQTEVLDILEKELVVSLKGLFKASGYKITSKGARNMIGKIGLRIVHGKKLVDKVFFGEKQK